MKTFFNYDSCTKEYRSLVVLDEIGFPLQT